MWRANAEKHPEEAFRVTNSEEIHGVFVFALKEKDKILCGDLHVKDLPWDHIEKSDNVYYEK